MSGASATVMMIWEWLADGGSRVGLGGIGSPPASALAFHPARLFRRGAGRHSRPGRWRGGQHIDRRGRLASFPQSSCHGSSADAHAGQNIDGLLSASCKQWSWSASLAMIMRIPACASAATPRVCSWAALDESPCHRSRRGSGSNSSRVHASTSSLTHSCTTAA